MFQSFLYQNTTSLKCPKNSFFLDISAYLFYIQKQPLQNVDILWKLSLYIENQNFICKTFRISYLTFFAYRKFPPCLSDRTHTNTSNHKQMPQMPPDTIKYRQACASGVAKQLISSLRAAHPCGVFCFIGNSSGISYKVKKTAPDYAMHSGRHLC